MDETRRGRGGRERQRRRKEGERRTIEKGNKGGKIGEILFYNTGIWCKTDPRVYPSFISISCFPRDDKRTEGSRGGGIIIGKPRNYSSFRARFPAE